MKRIISYPSLFTLAILLDRVAISSSQIGLNQSVRALFFFLLLIMAVTWTIQYFIQDWQHTDFIVLMIPVTLIAYRATYRFLEIHFPRSAHGVGLALIIVFGVLYLVIAHHRVWKSIKNPAKVTSYFNLVFIALLSFQVLRLGKDSYPLFTSMSHPQTEPIHIGDIYLKEELSPDIYVIVLDGYARQDVLQTIYKHDNSEFLNWLEKRGFYVANENHSNYIQTPYAMAAFWNMDYLQPWNSYYETTRYLLEPIQKNRVFRALDAIGYTTVSFEGPVNFTEIKTSDVYLSRFLRLNNFETLLLDDSPLEPLSNILDLGLPLQTYKTHRQRTLYQLESLKEIPSKISGPKIVYTHILAPHPPFVFDQYGNIRELKRPYTLAEGTEFPGGQEEYWYGYQEQTKFINTEIKKVIDEILATSTTPPVILLMGDHGPASMFNWNLETPSCLWERTSNFYAILLPGHQNDGTVYSSISPVNSFRVIFNTYFGTDFPLLEDNSYMMIWQRPTMNVNITERRTSQEGCTIRDE